MKKLVTLFSDSLHELKSVINLTTIAMLMGLAVILGFFTLAIGDFLKIGFSFIPNMLIGFLFGPAIGAIFGGAADILKFIVAPTGPFFPGFTISSIVSGVIYGMVLYHKPLHLGRIFVSNILVTLVVNILLNTYWLSVMYGNAFLVLLPARALKEVIMLPITSMLFFIIARTLEKATILKRIHA